MKNRTLNCQLFFSKTNDFLSYYLPCQAARSIHTIETYRDGLTVFRRYITNVQKISIKKFLFTDCTNELMLDYLGYLNSQGCEASTCNNRLAALRAYLWYASDMDISLQSIALSASHVPFLKEPKKEKQIIQDEDMKALLAAPPDTQKGNRDRIITILLYDTAIRIAELLELKISSLKLTSVPSIHIHGKGDKERSVSITDATVSHLKKYLRQFHPEMLPDQPLFYTKIKGSIAPMSPGNVSRIINKYADAIRSEHPNLPKHLHCHMFRRTRATGLYRNGVELEMISVILGHSSTETTRIYATPSIEMLEEAMNTANSTIPDETPEWVENEDELARICGFNNLIRNRIAHGKYNISSDAISLEASIFAHELLLDLCTLVHMIIRRCETEKMFRFVHEYKTYYGRFAKGDENFVFEPLLEDMIGGKTTFTFDTIEKYRPLQIAYWLLNPYYEKIYSQVADVSELLSLRSDFLSKDFWEFVLKRLDQIVSEGWDYMFISNEFLSVVNGMFKCNISSDTKKILGKVHAKLVKIKAFH